MPIAGHIVALTAAALIAGATWSETSLTESTVDCDQIILQVESGRYGGRRVVLGIVSVPPAYLPHVVSTRIQAWPYVSKAGLVIRAGSAPVRVSVHPGSRGQAAIEWGGSGIVNSLGSRLVRRSGVTPGTRTRVDSIFAHPRLAFSWSSE